METKEIEILDLCLIESGKPLKAFADVKLGDITIRDFRIVKEEGDACRYSHRYMDGYLGGMENPSCKPCVMGGRRNPPFCAKAMKVQILPLAPCILVSQLNEVDRHIDNGSTLVGI